MRVVDILNIYGLILIGLALFLGVAFRLAVISGVTLLTLYYFAYPPFGGYLMGATEGHLYIVNKIFLEAITLIFLLFYNNKGYGVYALKFLFTKKTKETDSKKSEDGQPHSNSRRDVLKNLATIPALGVMGWGAFRDYKNYGVDVMSGATTG